MIGKLSCLILFCLPLVLYGQILPAEDVLSDQIELETETRDLDAIAEHLQMRQVFINWADAEALMTLPKIGRATALAIIEHRQSYGAFNNAYELQQISGIEISDIPSLLPYLNFRRPAIQQIKSLTKQINCEVLFQAQTKTDKAVGYSEAVFQGDAVREHLRLKLDFSRALLLQFNLKKDAGEQYRYSSGGFSIYYKRNGIVQEMILGNYQIQFGQGLCIGKGLSMGKSSNTMGVMHASRGIRPSGSVNRSELFSGLALHLMPRSNIHLWLAASSRRTDARTSTDSNAQLWYQSDITSGYYRTEAEIQTRHLLQQKDYLSRVEWWLGHLMLSVSYVSSSKQGLHHLRLDPSHLQRQDKLGSECRFTFQNTVFFNELRYDVPTHQTGSIQGLLVSLDKSTDLSIIHRQYANNLNTNNSNALSAGNGKNEKGWLIGYQFKASKKTQINAYIDLFEHPQNSYLADGPAKGKDALVLLNYTEKNSLNLQIRFRVQANDFTSRHNWQMAALSTEYRQNLRVELSYKTGKHSELKHRLEMVNIRNSDQYSAKGYLMFHNWSAQHRAFKFHYRFSIFNTDDYNSRVYAYENDLSSVYTMKAWNDKGYAMHLIVQYHVNKIVQIKTKFAGVRYSDEHVTGTGNDRRSGYLFGDIKFEVLVKI